MLLAQRAYPALALAPALPPGKGIYVSILTAPLALGKARSARLAFARAQATIKAQTAHPAPVAFTNTPTVPSATPRFATTMARATTRVGQTVPAGRKFSSLLLDIS